MGFQNNYKEVSKANKNGIMKGLISFLGIFENNFTLICVGMVGNLNIVINYHYNKLNMEGLNKSKGIIQQGTRDNVHEM